MAHRIGVLRRIDHCWCLLKMVICVDWEWIMRCFRFILLIFEPNPTLFWDFHPSLMEWFLKELRIWQNKVYAFIIQLEMHSLGDELGDCELNVENMVHAEVVQSSIHVVWLHYNKRLEMRSIVLTGKQLIFLHIGSFFGNYWLQRFKNCV